MGVDSSELLVPFAGAIQAAFSVLLTIAFGVLAAQCNLLSTGAAKEVSKLCVRMFLPALLIYKIGSNLHQGTAVRYIPVLSKHCLHHQIAVVLTTRSLVDIVYAAFSTSRSRPNACFQASKLGDTGYCFQQHYESSALTHRVAETDANPRCHTRGRRFGCRCT